MGSRRCVDSGGLPCDKTSCSHIHYIVPDIIDPILIGRLAQRLALLRYGNRG